MQIMAREKMYFYFLALHTKKVADPCYTGCIMHNIILCWPMGALCKHRYWGVKTHDILKIEIQIEKLSSMKQNCIGIYYKYTCKPFIFLLLPPILFFGILLLGLFVGKKYNLAHQIIPRGQPHAPSNATCGWVYLYL